WLDSPGHDPAVLAANLADLRRVNRWLGGIRLTVHALDGLTADLRAGASLAILDLASGGADIPRAVAAWAARRGLRARVLATDLTPALLRLGAPAASPAACPLLFASPGSR